MGIEIDEKFVDVICKRYIESQIERLLKSSSAVLVAGPKFCGKTTTCLRMAKSNIRLVTRRNIELARVEPHNTLLGEQPRLIDEWQTVPELWDEIRAWADEKPGFGQFILTGSSTPADKSKIHHSGAGRIVTLPMRPMSLFESGDSTGTVSLAELFSSESPNVYDTNERHSLKDMAFYTCRGGWPLSILDDRDVALDVTANYYNGLFNFDTSENEKFRNKKPEVLRMILRSYARNISTEAAYKTIIQDIIESNNRTMDTKTFDDYWDALKDLFIISDIDAWNPNLRSKAVVRTTPTRHFVDTSIACQALNISPDDLMADLKSFGFFFEDLAVRDLNIYASLLGGTVKHYRDSRGLECDAVVHTPKGKWGAIEIKLGGDKLIEEGAANLNKLKDDVDDPNMAFMAIITATGPAYRRLDGIYVTPLNCLRA
jgi:predicted AAA+ superfamily ATPase